MCLCEWMNDVPTSFSQKNIFLCMRTMQPRRSHSSYMLQCCFGNIEDDGKKNQQCIICLIFARFVIISQSVDVESSVCVCFVRSNSWATENFGKNTIHSLIINRFYFVFFTYEALFDCVLNDHPRIHILCASITLTHTRLVYIRQPAQYKTKYTRWYM